MKLTLSWLKEYLDTNASLDEICNKLTNIGLEVESVEDKSKSLAFFSIAQIIEANPHPESSKLKICKVDVGNKEPLQIICGAANARVGIKVIYAPIDSIIPANGMKIKKSAIRGVESNGMLCSADELKLGTDSEGIIEIDNNIIVGTKITDLYGLNDAIIEINVTPNRGDCLGVYGIARDLSATGIGNLKSPVIKRINSTFKSTILAKTQDKNCPYFSGRYIKNIANQASPKWLKEKLEAIGLNSISAVVDITNYVLYSLNQPLHAYDADKIEGNITIRNAQDENFKSLKDIDYKLQDNELVIADDKKVLCLAGVIGGSISSCNLETKNIFLEAAFFEADSIAKTGRKLNILSDSRYRFERGIDLASIQNGLDMATNLILEICGGEASDIIETGTNKAEIRKINFDFNKVKKILGTEIAHDQIINILSDLGFKINGNEIIIPSFRNDVALEEDLVEEVIRIYGYDKIKSQALPNLGFNTIKENNNFNLITSTLCNSGMDEIVSFSFINSKIAEIFADKKEGLFIKNPISSDMSYMRPSLLPGLITAIRKNQLRGIENIAVFEIGKVFLGLNPDQQKNVISGIRVGKNKDRNLYHDERDFDILDVKKDFFNCLEIFGINPKSLQIENNAPSHYHPHRCATLKLGKNIIGFIGELHPIINKKMDVLGRINAFEIFTDNLPNNKKSNNKKAFIVSDLQIVKRDFAFILDEKINVIDLIKLIEGAEKELISKVNIFDIYRGNKISEGKKSVAFGIEIQPKIKTLTTEEIDQISNKIINLISSNLGGILRDGS